MRDNDWHHHFAEVNGIAMHYVRHGQGMPLVLLHGWPEFWFTWHKVIPTLARSFQVIAPDLRGFGQSDKPPGAALEAYTLDHHVDDLAALADALELDRFGIVSHDVGAMVAQGYARRAPARLAGLFFFNVPYPGVGGRWSEPEHLNEVWYQGFNQQPWAADLIGASRQNIRIYVGNMLAHWAHDSHAFDDDLEIWVDNFAAPGNLQGGFNWYGAIFPRRLAIMRGDVAPQPPITVPTKVRWGRHDPVMRIDFADRLPDYFTDLDFAPAPDAGHFVQYERPAYAAAEITTFFQDLERPGQDR